MPSIEKDLFLIAKDEKLDMSEETTLFLLPLEIVLMTHTKK